MSTGMEAVIQIPLRKRPSGLLIDVADQIPNSVRWKAGVTFEPWGCQGFTAVDADYCDFDSDPLDDAFTADAAPVFDAFQVYGTETCTTLDTDIAHLNARLDARWSVMVSEQVAARLQDELVARSTVASTGPLNSYELVAMAEQILATSLHGGVGLLHVSPAMLTVLVSTETVIGSPSTGYTTANGHQVVADPGHTGLPPDGETAPAGTEWAYVTGPVLYGLGAPITSDDAQQYLDRDDNQVTGRIIGSSVVAFDPCAAYAMQFGFPSFVEGS